MNDDQKAATLPDDEVHLWRINLDQPATLVEHLMFTLSAEERQRADWFHFESDRRRFVVGRGALRAILGRYLCLEPERVQFCYGPYGKPALPETINPDRICFNLAHSSELALGVFTRRRDIGVDLEQIRPMADMAEIARRFFSAQETATWLALPPEQQPEAFFNCWTRKEAYIKATGLGLTQPLDQFSVSLRPGEPARLIDLAGSPSPGSPWSMRALQLEPGYVAALVAAGDGWRLRCWHWIG